MTQEELVEEIRLLLCEECTEGPLHDEYGLDYRDGDCNVGAEEQCRGRARRAISRILKAVEDGMPLPDEAGREWLLYTYPPGYLELHTFRGWFEKIAEGAKQEGKQTLFIALRPPEKGGTTEIR